MEFVHSNIGINNHQWFNQSAEITKFLETIGIFEYNFFNNQALLLLYIYFESSYLVVSLENPLALR